MKKPISTSTDWSSTDATSSGYLCSDCGKPLWELWPSTTAGNLCDCGKLEKPQQYGWVCPVCGKGKSPSSTECSHSIEIW